MEENILKETIKKFMNITNYNYGNPQIIKETTQVNLVKNIQKFLNSGYEQGEQTEITPDGKFTSKKVIGVKTKNSGKTEIATNITPMDLFYRLEDEFKSQIDKSDKRTIFLKQNIIDWWNGFQGLDNGILSQNIST